MVKPFQLGFEPLTNDEYFELLQIGNLSDPDKEALRKRARAYELPSALSESENALRAIFGGLLNSARILSAKQLAPFTSDEQVAAEQSVIARWNAEAKADGWDVRMVQLGPGIGFEVGDVSTIRLKRGTWLSDVFALLWLTGEGEPVHPAMFDAQAGRHWGERLRHRVVSKRLGDPADLACREAERRRKQTRDWIEGIAAVWSSALDCQGVEGVIPPSWPMRWTELGPIPASKPHEADKSDIIIDPKTGKQVALFAIDNSRGALTPFPIQWRVGIGPNTRSVDRSDLEERKVALSSAVRSIEAASSETHYLQKRELLPAPRLQQIWRRTGTLYRDTWNDFQLDTRTLPVYRDEVGITEIEEDEIDA